VSAPNRSLNIAHLSYSLSDRPNAPTARALGSPESL
jgi:hypothetical protein